MQTLAREHEVRHGWHEQYRLRGLSAGEDGPARLLCSNL